MAASENFDKTWVHLLDFLPHLQLLTLIFTSCRKERVITNSSALNALALGSGLSSGILNASKSPSFRMALGGHSDNRSLPMTWLEGLFRVRGTVEKLEKRHSPTRPPSPSSPSPSSSERPSSPRLRTHSRTQRAPPDDRHTSRQRSEMSGGWTHSQITVTHTLHLDHSTFYGNGKAKPLI